MVYRQKSRVDRLKKYVYQNMSIKIFTHQPLLALKVNSIVGMLLKAAGVFADSVICLVISLVLCGVKVCDVSQTLWI